MAKVQKPEGASTYKELSGMQEASLRGVSSTFINQNTEFINNLASKVQSIAARYNQSIAASSPQQLIDAVQTRVQEKKKFLDQNDNSKQGFVTGVKGLTDLSKDMDLFRELYPIATPMFELFYEYQMVHSMIPEAAKCFDILKNSVLSADSFSKKYIIPKYDNLKLDSKAGAIGAEEIQQHVKLIKDIVEEYDLNIAFDQYITDAMKYGAKPIMIIPIDETFRKSAEDVLRTESADDVRKIIRDSYDAGTEVAMEAALEGTEFTANGISLDSASPFALEFNAKIDALIPMYEDALQFEEAMYEEQALTTQEKVQYKKNIDERKKAIADAKDKSKRQKVMTEMTHYVNKLVNSKVRFSLATETVSLRTVSKIAGQIKTYRRSQNYQTRGLKTHRTVTHENANLYENADPSMLDTDVQLVIEMMQNTKYEKSTREVNGTTVESWNPVIPDIHSFESKIGNVKSSDSKKVPESFLDPNKTVSNKTTGSVIIPLAPDTVIPISVHGKHIGYYVIERLGNDDLGSGVATMLGYKPPNSMYSIGMAGHMYTGNGAMTGTDGAGVILRDMTDLPMNVRDDGQRIDLLRSMLTRAISERIGNPDIVDDTAFNSIIFSLIKDNYITKREIRITYVPAHQMVYFAHEIDPDSGIGVSVFKNGLFFAHIYVASLITNLMIAISKSADREQVNVEIGSHGRIEATVQKVMRTLQTKRASVDSIGNIDTIMKTLGTFQRYISLKHNGTPLIELETIPGQDVDLENTLMEKALQSFINSFYVPASAINQLNEMEYARSITLQNALFLDKVVMLQLPYQECMSKFARILVRNKFPEKIHTNKNVKRVGENAKKEDDRKTDITDTQGLIVLEKVELELPSPEGLNIMSFNDQIGNVSTFADSLIDLLIPLGIKEDSVESIKTLLKRKMFEKYLPNLPFDEFDAMAEEANTDIQSAKFAHPEVPEDQQFGGDGAGGGGSSSSSSGGGGFGDMGGMDDGMGDMGDMGGGMDDMGGGEEGGGDEGGGDDFKF